MIVRAKSFKAWMLANLGGGQIAELAEHGADAGWPGLTYYTDTVKLYDKYEDEIWEALAEDADSFGTTPLKMIAGFVIADGVQDAVTFKNLLTWYMAERIARELTDDDSQ